MTCITRQDDISAVPLSVRSLNCLRRANIRTIGAMLDYPVDEFINIRNMGVRSVEEIRGCIRILTEGTGEYVLVEAREQTFDEPRENTSNNIAVTVFLDETGAVVQDMPVTSLRLSVRAKNSLTRGGYEVASQLIGVTYEELMNVQNMGKKTAEEVLEYIAQISVVRENCAVTDKNSTLGGDLATEMYVAYGEAESIWLREVLTIKAQFPEAVGETLIYRLYDSTLVRGTVKAKILQMIEENDGEISKTALERSLPQHLNNTTILEEILLELEAISALELGEVMIYRQYPSIVQFAAKIQNDRIREVIQGRISGKTLQEIGEQYDITRERVRQIMQKGLRSKPYLQEDKYAYIYDHYDFSMEDFRLAFDEPNETYNYLEMICTTPRPKRKPLDELLVDTSVSLDLKKKVERVIFKQYILIDGVRIKKTRPNMVRHFVKTYCKSPIEFDKFFQQYHEWLDTLGLRNTPELVLESRTYENIFNKCDYVLWSQWRRFRYYNIAEQEYEDLLSALDLEQYQDTELSARKFFRDYPDLMQQYNIFDEYELHNLLKKVWPSDNSNVKFKKMPTIEIGTANRDDQILSLLLQYAPISADEFAAKYEETYGTKASTVLGSYMGDFDVYFFNGMYSISSDNLPFEQFERMKFVLCDDFYTISKVKHLYLREFPNANGTQINPYTLKTLGFYVYSGYIIKNTYPSASDYFRELLTTEEVVDTRTIDRSIRNMITFSSVLQKLRSNYTIIEFSPLQYINIRRLAAAKIDAQHLMNYCKDVASIYERGEYFTMSSLRKEGFVHPLDDLGFDEWFYSSLLVEDREAFAYQRIGGTRLFLRGGERAQLSSMLVWLLEKHSKFDFYDLVDLLENHYGIVLPKVKLIDIIRSTDLYYDTIMEAVYIDYDTYFEEI